MKKFGLFTLLILIGAGVIALAASLFTVKETQQALVLQFGNPVRTVQEPGLHLKVPFIQSVVYLDSRKLFLDTPVQEVITNDQKRIIIDAFTEYRIEDPLRVYQTVRNITGAENRLSTMVNSTLRLVLGKQEFKEILTGERQKLRDNVMASFAQEAESLGIKVVDVRIRRTDLPAQNSENIFSRMRTEREREAKEARALGEEEALRIRSGADKEKTIILAEAEKASQKLRGEGDAQATKIFADAFSKDPEFFSFYRSMQAYREALKEGNGDTTMVLSPDSDFFRYFGDLQGKK